MSKSSTILYKICYWLCSILLFAMTFLIFGQVISRYLFKNSLTWSEELGRYFYIWISIIGIAVAIPMGAHVSLDLITAKLGLKSKRIVTLIGDLLLSIFALIFTYSGFVLTLTSFDQISSGIDIPMSYVYIVFPISGMIMLFFLIKKLIEDYKKEV